MDEISEATENDSIWAEFYNDLFRAIKKVEKATEDMFGYLIIHLDENVCLQLDAYVEAGIAENRQQAATYFLTEGMKARKDLFDRVEQTELQVEKLRQKIRALKVVESAE